MAAPTALRSGPAAPWISGTDVAALPAVAKAIAANNALATPTFTPEQVSALCDEAAAQSSELLYLLSGRQFTGEAGPVTIRPVAERQNNEGLWFWGGAWGWGAYTGSFAYMGMAPSSAVLRWGDTEPPTLDLGAYPVTDIVQVLINGELIPPDEYELRDFRYLLRIIPTPTSQPTAVWGWPFTQAQWLPDTQQGTFSVTFKFGQVPGPSGIRACKDYAEVLILPHFNTGTGYPQRITSINRQGVSMQIVDVIDIVNKGMTGVYSVDAWLRAVNPTKAVAQSLCWSPDMARPRRQATPSVSGGST